ncbi:MAG: hydrolase, partial [Defluviitaleaceae bacterium]|nr:hydrolase [Defluviitaleaceae bacterium]
MDFKLVINGQGTTCDATRLIEGTMKLTSERRGSPAKLEFSVMRHEGLAFYEGNQVALTVKGVPMFCGYVFKKKRKKDQLIQVTAYDQLRYLKNKDTLVYENKTASQVITMLAADYKLKTGPIADTGYVIPCRSEDMQTLMDIMYNALDLTLINAGELYVLYDDFGALTLKNIRDMRLNVVISSRYKMIDFDYATDIDQDTANRVKLVKDNNDTGRREAYIEM